MTLQSMTGFARAQGAEGAFTWGWEVKSVNGKGLDLRTRLPQGFEALEPQVRERLSRHCRRGNVTVALNLYRASGSAAWRVNEAFLDEVVQRLVPKLRAKLPDSPPPAIDGLLGLRGVIEPLDEDDLAGARDELEPLLLADLDQALAQLADMRRAEGTRLDAVLSAQLQRIEALTGDAARLAALQPDALKRRMADQIAAVLEAGAGVAEERLAQELALLITKADVREELDRLVAHAQAARELMAHDEPVGRRLDFLCQEFNREANTLCSKSPDVELTRIGLDLKATIEQFREQVQNIE